MCLSVFQRLARRPQTCPLPHAPARSTLTQMKPTHLLLLLSVSLLAACATTTFKAFETREPLIINGTGGTRTVQDGMDIWNSGEPPRKFKVIGIIEDDRPGGVIPMAQLRSDIVRKAREAGGQAVIQVRSQSQIVGYQTMASARATSFGNTTAASGMSTSIPFRRNSAQFVVIQYID